MSDSNENILVSNPFELITKLQDLLQKQNMHLADEWYIRTTNVDPKSYSILGPKPKDKRRAIFGFIFLGNEPISKVLCSVATKYTQDNKIEKISFYLSSQKYIEDVKEIIKEVYIKGLGISPKEKIIITVSSNKEQCERSPYFTL